MTAPTVLLERGIQAARQGRKAEARELILKVVEAEPNNETAWIWLAALIDSPQDKRIAYQNALAINPSNEKVRVQLYRLIAEQDSARQAHNSSRETVHGQQGRSQAAPPSPNIGPRGLAKQHEAEGRLDEAIRVLADIASTTKDSNEFDRLYREISRLESLQKESIAHIAPASSVLRMTLSWPLLYVFLAAVQTGLNPFARAAWFLWVGLPVVIGGAFLLAVAEVGAPHVVWGSVFTEQDGIEASAARVATAAAGWILIGVPHLFLLLDSLNRLSSLRIPVSPLPGS